MSTFTVEEHTLTVEPHPDADRLDIVQPEGTLYRAIAQKGRFSTGDVAVYVPEGAVLPERVLKASGFWDEEKGKGTLAGSAGDRVKSIKLRGILSQGILISLDDASTLADHEHTLGGDWASVLGITKYQAPIPREMSGTVYACGGLRGYTDIQNVKNHPGVLGLGDPIVVTEKLHGTCTIMSTLCDDGGECSFNVSSKGLASKGLALQYAEHNVYWRAAMDNDIAKKLAAISDAYAAKEVTLFGETLGVQDLMYGLSGGEVSFRAFDLRIDGKYLDPMAFWAAMEIYGIPTVPTLFMGAYEPDFIWTIASGKTTAFDGDGKPHIREGVVVRPMEECDDPRLGRVILKFVSDAYLTRKGNATEME